MLLLLLLALLLRLLLGPLCLLGVLHLAQRLPPAAAAGPWLLPLRCACCAC